MIIHDIDKQVKLCLNEIENRYTKGIEFSIYDLFSLSSCINASNFNILKNRLVNQMMVKKIAHLHSGRNGKNIYIKL